MRLLALAALVALGAALGAVVTGGAYVAHPELCLPLVLLLALALALAAAVHLARRAWLALGADYGERIERLADGP